MAEIYNKFPQQVLTGWAQTFNMTAKAPAIAKRIFETYAAAEVFMKDNSDTAVQGLLLSVVGETGENVSKNGVYQIALKQQPGTDMTAWDEIPNEDKFELKQIDASAAQVSAGNGIEVTSGNVVSVKLANTGAGTQDDPTKFKSGLKFDENGNLLIATANTTTDGFESGLVLGEKGIGVKIGNKTDGGHESGLQTTAYGVEVKLNDTTDGGHQSGLETTKKGLGIKLGDTTTEGPDPVPVKNSGLAIDADGLAVKANAAKAIEVTTNGVGVKVANTTSQTPEGSTTTNYVSGLQTTEAGLSVKLHQEADGTGGLLHPASGLSTTDTGLKVNTGDGVEVFGNAVKAKTNAKKSAVVEADGIGVNADGVTIINDDYQAADEHNPEKPSSLKVKVAADRTTVKHDPSIQSGTAVTNSGKNILAIDTTSTSGLYATAYIKEIPTTTSEGNVLKSYQLYTQHKGADGSVTETALGDKININKDQSLGSIELVALAPYTGNEIQSVTTDNGTAPTSASHPSFNWKEGQFLRYEYMTADGKHQWVYINVSSFLTEAEFKNGLKVNTSTGEVEVKIGKGLRFGTAGENENKPIDVKLSRTAADTDDGVEDGVENSGLVFSTDGNEGLKVNVDPTTGLVIKENKVGLQVSQTNTGDAAHPTLVNESGLEVGARVLPGQEGTGPADGSVAGLQVKKGNGIEIDKTGVSVKAKDLKAQHQVTQGAADRKSVDVTADGVSVAAESTPLLHENTRDTAQNLGIRVGIECGGYKPGDKITWNESIFEVLRKLLEKTTPSTVTNPTISVSGEDKVLEVGDDFSISSTVTFKDGKYTGYWYSVQGQAAGCTASGDPTWTAGTGTTTTGKTTTWTGKAVAGTKYLSATQVYTEGTSMPHNSDGDNEPNLKIAGGTTPSATGPSVTGKYKYYTAYVKDKAAHRSGVYVTNKASLASIGATGEFGPTDQNEEIVIANVTASVDTPTIVYVVPQGYHVTSAETPNGPIEAGNLAGLFKPQEGTPTITYTNNGVSTQYDVYVSYLAGGSTTYKNIHFTKQA